MNYSPVEPEKPFPIRRSLRTHRALHFLREWAWLIGTVLSVWLFLVLICGVPKEKVTLGIVSTGVSVAFWTFLLFRFPQWGVMLTYGIIASYAILLLTAPGGWQLLAASVVLGWLINSCQNKRIKAISPQTLLAVNVPVAGLIAIFSGFDSGLWLRIVVGAVGTTSFLLLMALFDYLSTKDTSRLGRVGNLVLFIFAAMVWFSGLVGGSIYFFGKHA